MITFTARLQEKYTLYTGTYWLCENSVPEMKYDATNIGFSSTRSSMKGESQCFRWLPFHISIHVLDGDVRNQMLSIEFSSKVCFKSYKCFKHLMMKHMFIKINQHQAIQKLHKMITVKMNSNASKGNGREVSKTLFSSCVFSSVCT